MAGGGVNSKAPLDRRAAAVYLVASLTTSPSRLRTIGPTLRSLGAEHQRRPFDEVLLNLPRTFGRTGEGYPAQLPAVVTEVASVNRVEEDWGPATKLVPTVRYLLHARLPVIAQRLGLPPHGREDEVVSRTHIVIVDDDIVYPAGMAASFAETASPLISEATSGFVLVPRTLGNPRGHVQVRAKHGAQLDVAEGFGGWRIPLAAFDRNVSRFEARMRSLISDRDARVSDDLLASEYLAERSIPLALHRTAHFSKAMLQIRELGLAQDALHRTNTSGDEHWARYWRVLESGRLHALHMPERWGVLCPARMQPLPPPACRNLSGTRGFHLLGERHCGTNALSELMRITFDARGPSYREAYKHMWTTDSPAALAAMGASLRRLQGSGQPVVIMVREAVQWLNAMRIDPHHAPWMRFMPMAKFVSVEWVSSIENSARSRAKCEKLGLLPRGSNESDMAAIRRLGAGQQRRCAVHAFDSILALRSAKLRLLRDAFDLVPADESAQREQLVRTVSRSAGGGPVLVLRYEDFVLRAHAVPCMLARQLRVCAPRSFARLASEPLRPGGTPAAALGGAVLKHGRISTVADDPCKLFKLLQPYAAARIRDGLDWGLEQLFGYGDKRTYAECMPSSTALVDEFARSAAPAVAKFLRHIKHDIDIHGGLLNALSRRRKMQAGYAREPAAANAEIDWSTS